MKSRLRTARSRRIAVASTFAVLLPLAFSSAGEAAPKAVAHGPNGQPARPGAARQAPEAHTFRIDHGAGEPTLAITPRGTVLITTGDGCVTSCPGSAETVDTVAPGGRAVFKTTDNGKTWVNVSPGVGDASPHVVSLDPYIYIDEGREANRVFDIDLTVACSILSFTDDEGATWVTNPMACGEPVNDHQTLFAGPPVQSPTVGYPNIVYYCFNQLIGTKCSKSLNGGLSFMPTGSIASPPECSGLNGHGVTDAKGTVYIPLGVCGKPTLAISRDEADSWQTVQISPDMRNDSGGDPSVAVDAKGNLYYLFVEAGNRLPHLSVSRDGGKTWSKPVNVAPRGMQATNLATLDVGDPGKVGIAYYGTRDPDAKKWTGYLALGVDVLGRSPVFYTSPIGEPGAKFKVGRCGPGRCGRVLDFIDVEIAPDGTPWGAYVDACLAICEKTGQESINDNQAVVGRLVGGPKLR